MPLPQIAMTAAALLPSLVGLFGGGKRKPVETTSGLDPYMEKVRNQLGSMLLQKAQAPQMYARIPMATHQRQDFIINSLFPKAKKYSYDPLGTAQQPWQTPAGQLALQQAAAQVGKGGGGGLDVGSFLGGIAGAIPTLLRIWNKK